MTEPPAPEIAAFPRGSVTALAVFERVRDILAPMGPFDLRVSKSQVAFHRRRGFAYVWIPGRYLAAPGAEVVLSVALGRHDRSPRFKEVAHPSRLHWMHHLEVDGVDDPRYRGRGVAA